MCKREYLNYLRVREWQDYESPAPPGLPSEMRVETGRPADQPDADGIHQALLAGLLSHIGALDQREAPRPGRSGGGGRCGSTSAPAARGSRSSPAAG